MKLNQTATLMALSLLMMASCMAEVITIEDSKGRSMMVDLLAGNDQSVKIKRLKDGKVFSMPFSSLSEKSKKEIKKKLKTLKPEQPPLEATVVIGKRSNSRNRDYYSDDYSDQRTITAKITLTNKDRGTPSPPCHCNIIFIGERMRNKDEFMVLSNQPFELVPTAKGTIFKSEPFISSYSYKYKGYLLVVSNDEGRILHTKTLLSEIKKAMATQANFASKFSKYTQYTRLKKSMLKAKSRELEFRR